MLDRVVNKGLGRLKVLLGWLDRPVKLQRTPQECKKLARETSGMALYDYKWCPRSLKARHEIHHLNIDIERRDIQKSPVHQDNLIAQFGLLKAPCLRVEENGEVLWLDEPDEIVHYLHERFGDSLEKVSA
jgi:hypothetical protein